MDRELIKEKVYDYLANNFRIFGEITDSQKLGYDLGLDSFDLVELIIEMENDLCFVTGEEELIPLNNATVAELIDFIEKKVNG